MGKGKGKLYKSGPRHIISQFNYTNHPGQKRHHIPFSAYCALESASAGPFFFSFSRLFLSQGGGRCHRQGDGGNDEISILGIEWQ